MLLLKNLDYYKETKVLFEIVFICFGVVCKIVKKIHFGVKMILNISSLEM